MFLETCEGFGGIPSTKGEGNFCCKGSCVKCGGEDCATGNENCCVGKISKDKICGVNGQMPPCIMPGNYYYQLMPFALIKICNKCSVCMYLILI